MRELHADSAAHPYDSRDTSFNPEFPISTCLDPSDAPSSARAIVVSLADAVKLAIKLTRPSGGGVNWCSTGSGGGFPLRNGSGDLCHMIMERNPIGG